MLLLLRRKVQILGDPAAFTFESLHVQVNPVPGNAEIGIIKVDVQEVNEPGQLRFVKHINGYNLF
jgi:hypothetical protein